MTSTPPLACVMTTGSSYTTSETETDQHDANVENVAPGAPRDLIQQQQPHYCHRVLFSSIVKKDTAANLEPAFSFGYMTCNKQAETMKSPMQRGRATSRAASTWELAIAPGVDPAFMICLAAVTRELAI
jgi:hypothetical protein